MPWSIRIWNKIDFARHVEFRPYWENGSPALPRWWRHLRTVPKSCFYSLPFGFRCRLRLLLLESPSCCLKLKLLSVMDEDESCDKVELLLLFRLFPPPPADDDLQLTLYTPAEAPCPIMHRFSWAAAAADYCSAPNHHHHHTSSSNCVSDRERELKCWWN